MAWQALLVEMTKALAWPVVVLATVLLLRKNLIRLVALVSKVKYGDLEIQFSQQIEEAESIAAELPVPKATLVALGQELQAALAQIGAEPRSTILLAWLRLEAELIGKAKDIFKSLGKPEHRPGVGDAINVLVKNAKLSPETASLIQELRVLRNEAVHALEVQLSADDAAKYVDLANRALRLLLAPSNAVE